MYNLIIVILCIVSSTLQARLPSIHSLQKVRLGALAHYWSKNAHRLRQKIHNEIEEAITKAGNPLNQTFQSLTQSEMVDTIIKRTVISISEHKTFLEPSTQQRLLQKFRPFYSSGQRPLLYGATTPYILGETYGKNLQDCIIGINQTILKGLYRNPNAPYLYSCSYRECYEFVLLHEMAHLIHGHVQEREASRLLMAKGMNASLFYQLFEAQELQADLYSVFLSHNPLKIACALRQKGLTQDANYRKVKIMNLYRYRNLPMWQKLIEELRKAT